MRIRGLAFALLSIAAVACGEDGSSHDNTGSAGNRAGGSGGMAGASGTAGNQVGGSAGMAGPHGGAGSSGAAGTNAGAAGTIGGGGGAAGKTGGGGKGGAAGRGGSGGAGGAAGQPGCADADYSAAPVLPVAHTDAAAPTPMGGTIASGTYYLTDFMYYAGTEIAGGICNTTLQYRLDVTASSDTTGTIRETLNFPGCCSFPTTWTYQTTGTTVAGPSTCGTPTPHSETYTATPTQVLWFRTATTNCWSNTTILFTFTKQ